MIRYPDGKSIPILSECRKWQQSIIKKVTYVSLPEDFVMTSCCRYFVDIEDVECKIEVCIVDVEYFLLLVAEGILELVDYKLTGTELRIYETAIHDKKKGS